MLTPKERTLRIYLKILLGIYLILFTAGIYYVFIKRGDIMNARTPFSVGLTALFFLEILMCWYAAADLRRNVLIVKLLVWTSVLSSVISALILLKYDSGILISVFGNNLSLKAIGFGALGFNTLNALILGLLMRSAEKERYDLKYFSPLQFRTLSALADVVITGKDEIIPCEDVAKNVDRYFNTFRAKGKWTMAAVVTALYFYPILSLKPPLPYLSYENRLEFLKHRFYRDINARIMPEFFRALAQGIIRIAKQMCYIGYYNDERTFDSVGYVPFSKRKNFDERIHQFPGKDPNPLKVLNEQNVNEDSLEGDVIIIGTGAGASILAKGLVENGRSVLMIERGDYIPPAEYSEDEMDMVSRLYEDGAIQAARDFRFTVFQGSCVGGSTVVNNAVCFKMPDEVLEKWNDKSGINAGLDTAGVNKSMDNVWNLLNVKQMPEQWLNPGGKLFKEGCRKLGLGEAPNIVESVNANIENCIGCGYCNIGCKYGKKLSMLESVLPQIQKKYGEDRLRIIAGCEAVKIHKKNNKIVHVECKFTSGRKINIYGKTFAVSAGAISSSILLLKSKLGIKNAGKKLSFNMGSQMTAAYPQKIDSYDGLQISHYFKMNPGKGFIMESWFNPPMFQSTAMPGWFDDHYRNMKRYDRLACVGLLVGTKSNAEVRIAGLTGREINYTPDPQDFEALLNGLELSADILFASGAESVMPNNFTFHEFKSPEDVKQNLRRYVKDPSEITLGTGHPQGGNIMTGSSETGVVNSEFKVHGFDNLFICDASVFPTSLGVNPQITVMGLADYAVQFVKNNNG
jgi:choline dehydrogenase-like flavoprotein